MYAVSALKSKALWVAKKKDIFLYFLTVGTDKRLHHDHCICELFPSWVSNVPIQIHYYKWCSFTLVPHNQISRDKVFWSEAVQDWCAHLHRIKCHSESFYVPNKQKLLQTWTGEESKRDFCSASAVVMVILLLVLPVVVVLLIVIFQLIISNLTCVLS